MLEQSSPSEKIRARVLISGIVQGVGYRYSTFNQARSIGVNGWVRNLDDGRVEAVFEGSQVDVAAMINWCEKGSPAAVVKDVAVEYESLEGIEDFSIKRGSY